MKTIFFLASELDPAMAGRGDCNDLYKIIYKHLSAHKAKTFFDLKKWDQPTGPDILDKIEELPAYIHYCGHGNKFGDLQIINSEGEPHSFKKELLEKPLENHSRLECLLLGSCNSDKVIDRLRLYAEYSIGFTNSPSAYLVNKFYNEFYAHLAKYGSPFKAFYVARDRLIADYTKTADGAKAILRSKNNFIMELIALDEQSTALKAKFAEKETSISKVLNQLASLEGESRSVFEQLLLEHPFAEDMFLFYSHKEKLAHDIAMQIMDGENEDDVEFFSQRLFMAFEVLEKILLAEEERELALKSLSKIGEGMPKDQSLRAFRKLGMNEVFRGCPDGFKILLERSIKFCLDGLFK